MASVDDPVDVIIPFVCEGVVVPPDDDGEGEGEPPMDDGEGEGEGPIDDGEGESEPPVDDGEGEDIETTLFFASDGKTWPWYANATSPNAIYVSATDTTWFTWESFQSSQRVVRCATYNHTTGVWSGNHLVGASSLTNDDHGVPAIVRDHEGYVHCFYGAHNSTIIERVTDSPDDPSAWTQRNTLTVAQGLTYPHPVLVGSQLYLIIRVRINVSQAWPARLYRTTALANGIATWGSSEQLVHYQTDTRTYIGNSILDGTDLHFVATRANLSDTFRRDIYHYVLDTTTGNIRNSDGSTVVLAANRPVLLADSNSNFRVAEISDMTNVPGFCIDTSGNLHIAYMDGSGSTFDVKHVMFDGDEWSESDTVVTLTNQARWTALQLVPLPDGEVALWHSEDEAANWARGGSSIVRRIRSVGGTWGSPTTILTATSYALEEPQQVGFAHPDARVIFCEIAGTSSNSVGGDLKLYAHGDSGFLERPI